MSYSNNGKETTIKEQKTMKMFNQGTSKPEASHSENIREENEENGDMAWACCEELVELDDVQLATVVGGSEGKQYISSINKGQQAYFSD